MKPKLIFNKTLKVEEQSSDVKNAIFEIGGMWLALQKYGDIENKVGPFKISIYEALENEILAKFDHDSFPLVLSHVYDKYTRFRDL